MIKYAIDHGLYNEKYVKECTNALFKVRTDFETCEDGTKGVFSGLTGGTYNANLQATFDATYSKTTWDYQKTGTGPYVPGMATDLNDPDCVFQKLKKQFDNYTIPNVCAITGTDPIVYEQICQTYCSTYPDDKSACMCYALGTTQHTHGVQNIRSYSILQLLLGNMGVAGGGINALRGQDNVQGSTDMCILNHILPGYLAIPITTDVDLTAYLNRFHTASMGVDPVHNYTVRGVSGKDPLSAYWWQNANKYIVSQAKAWWPAIDHNTSFNYFPKKTTADYSLLSMIHAINAGTIKGFYAEGVNITVSDTDQNFERAALKKLDWMVCVDIFETEQAAFWRLDPAGTPTTVYLLPAASALEQHGTKINSGRWVQWSYKGTNPPGEAKPNTWITTSIGERIQQLYSGSTAPEDAPITKLNWPCFNYVSTDLNPANEEQFTEKIAKEVNGYNMVDTNADTIPDSPTTLVASFANLQANGTTSCGNWLYCNQFVEIANLDPFETANQSAIWPLGGAGNRTKRRYAADVPNLNNDPQYKKIGLYSYYSWCWPVNRRIVYNRAATYQNDGGSSGVGLAGDPLAPNKYVLRWDATASAWRGDVPDHGGLPGAVYPFIMQKDGHGHLFGGFTVADGPFPWHYEPLESPIAYPSWLGNQRCNPIVHIYPGTIDNPIEFAAHSYGDDEEYPIVCTTYRFTEHYHTIMTREMPKLNQLQPEPIVEMSEELAADLGVGNGEMVRLTSIRGSIELKACVTKRFKPFVCYGETIHEVGLQWTWGFMALNPGPSANILTPFVGDPNTRIMEYKAFRIKIEKVIV
jgi:formate dehydrogenase major subunit